MRAFHGKQETKDFYLRRIRRHRDADRIVQGRGWEHNGVRWRGCAIGCSFERYDHWKMVEFWDIPVDLAYIEDSIFEDLDPGDAVEFPLQFCEAIAVGADLSNVGALFRAALLDDHEHGVIGYTFRGSPVHTAIFHVAEFLRGRGDFDKDAVRHLVENTKSPGGIQEFALDLAAHAIDIPTLADVCEKHAQTVSWRDEAGCELDLLGEAYLFQRDKLLELIRAAPMGTE